MAPKVKTTKPQQGATRRPRGSLSRAEIVRGAFELAEEEGVESLSMLRLARHLGVGVTSIYWYVRSKEDLLEALGEEAAIRLDRLLPVHDGCAWDEHLLRYFRDFRQAFRENPVLCDLIVRRAPMHENSPEARRRFLMLLEREIGALVDEGFPVADAVDAYATLSVYARGVIFNERLFSDAEERHRREGYRTSGPETDLTGMPLMAAASSSEQWSPSFATDEKFEAGIHFIIEGLRAHLAALKSVEPESVELESVELEAAREPGA